MVFVNVRRDKSGKPTGFTCSGHAKYGKKGSDIVCAGISALTITTVLALEKLTKLQLAVNEDAKTGILECSWTGDAAEVERTDLIIQVMILGLTEIQQQYPDHLKVSEVEV